MQKILQSKIFWSFFTIILVAGLIFFLNSFRGFQSQMDILLIPKSKITAKNADIIQNDIAKIIRSLNFYDQLLNSENLSTELSMGRSASERKSDWQKRIEVKKSKNSNILLILAYDTDKIQAEILSQKVARQISDIMSDYYNIKNDLEIRIIDGPVTEKKTGFFNPFAWLLSLLFAIAGGLVAFLTFNSFALAPKSEEITFFENSKPSKNEVTYQDDPYIFSSQIEEIYPEKELAEREAIQDEVSVQETTKVSPEKNLEIFPLEDYFPSEELVLPKKEIFETEDAFTKKASAPSNLPIAENFNLSFQSEKQSSQEEILEILEKAKASKEIGVKEATPEEVKARLNRLLKG